MRELQSLTFFLFFLTLFFTSTEVTAQQVTFDNNEQTESSMAGNPTIANFTVPAGSDRLLVVVFSAANSASTPSTPTVSFGTDNLMEAVSSEDGGRKTVTFFLPLGAFFSY
ncbi:MAG: hypothetical protein AAF960_30230 [Bacteroidota bacterium]